MTVDLNKAMINLDILIVASPNCITIFVSFIEGIALIEST